MTILREGELIPLGPRDRLDENGDHAARRELADALLEREDAYRAMDAAATDEAHDAADERAARAQRRVDELQGRAHGEPESYWRQTMRESGVEPDGVIEALADGKERDVPLWRQVLVETGALPDVSDEAVREFGLGQR